MNQSRIASVDLAKGICISIVMLFHIKGIIQDDCVLSPVLFSACMLPPFYFLSGLFFKEEKTMRLFLLKKVNKLLIPFAFFYLATSVIIPNLLHFVWGMQFETVVGWPSLWAFVWPGEYPNFPIWFLWCLFVMNLLFWAIHYCSKQCFPHSKFAAIAVLSIGCGCLGFYAETVFDTDIANLFEAMKSIPLFAFGYLSAQVDVLARLESASGLKKAACLLLSFFVSLLSCCSFADNLAWMDLLVYYVYGTAGISLILIVSTLIVRLPLISYLGRYSIIVLLSHGLLARLGYQHFVNLSASIGQYGAVILFWLLMAFSYLVIIPLFRRFLPHVTGQAPLLKVL